MVGGSSSDVIQLRLPLKSPYLTVLRSTVGVIAGTLDFGYDEIMQFRAAMSEVFELAIKRDHDPEGRAEPGELLARFEPGPDSLQIDLNAGLDLWADLGTDALEESKALLESLMDRVELGPDKGRVWMVKYKTIRPLPTDS